MSWVQVYSAANALEAHSLKGMLGSQGIEVMLKGESLSSAAGALPPDIVAVTLWVDVMQEDKARQALEVYEEQSETIWHCSHCREENGGSFEVCWQCNTPRGET